MRRKVPARKNHLDSEEPALRINFRKIERREWWLWGSAGTITLLLTFGLVSFLLPDLHGHEDFFSIHMVPQAIRGLVGLVFVFNLYTIYQHLMIYRIRRRLVEREELFHLISENTADMIAVVDMNGNRIFNSPSYQRVLGYSNAELRASSSLAQIHPDDRERVNEASREARRTGKGATLVYRFQHKNGSWVWMESTSNVVRNAKGEPERLVVVNRDITERKRAEEAVQRSEAGYRSIVQDAPYGIYRASDSGRFLRVNPALREMLGYEVGEELLLFQKDLKTEIFRNASEYARLIDLLARVGEVRDVETEWLRRDGTAITVRCSGRRIVDDQSGSSYFAAFAEDVTERRVLEKQLRMAQKMEAIGRLTGGIAHDFNNLLGVIIGYSGVLKKNLAADSPSFEHAVEIEKAGERAASLTKQLLAFSRQQVMKLVVININSVVLDMKTMLLRLLGEDIEVSLSLDTSLGRVKADQSQLEQVIMNLAVNARDAMPSGGELKIGTSNVELGLSYTRSHPGSRVGSFVLFTVSDTGMGMDTVTLTHIFEPFFTTKERSKGTGLGLATVYGIVKQSSGYIGVDSIPGKGTTFQVYLPLYRGEPADEEQKSDSAPKLTGTETLLLVEDSEPLRKLAKCFLESAGFRVLSAESGEHALEVAKRFGGSFDLLVTDVVMPGMSGRILAEHLQQRQPDMKVLYMSGYTDSFIAGHGVLEQGTNLLHKPFKDEVLILKVREVLDNRKNSDSVQRHPVVPLGSKF